MFRLASKVFFFKSIPQRLHLPCLNASLTLRRNLSSMQHPLTHAETLVSVYESLIYKPLTKPSELEKLLDVCLFFAKYEDAPELTNQDHQKIILTFSQFLQDEQISFHLIHKFMQYTDAFRLSNRINSSDILKKMLGFRKILTKEQKFLPEIMNFFWQTNVPKFEMNLLMDKIVPIYDEDLTELRDSMLISLFYHVIFLKWKYDKKPDLNEPDEGQIEINEEVSNEKKNRSVFLESCEAELEYRLPKMSNEDFVSFTRILTLNQTRSYQNSTLFSSCLSQLLIRVSTLKEDDLVSIVKNLRFFNEFPEDFIDKFEKNLLETDVSEYQKPQNLYILLSFFKSRSLKSRSALILTLCQLVNKNTMKSMSKLSYKAFEGFGRNRDQITLIMNELILMVAYDIEELEFVRNTAFPKELLRIYQNRILKNDKAKHLLTPNLCQKIEEIKTLGDFQKVLSFTNQINVKNVNVLNSLFTVFRKLARNFELSAGVLASIMRHFQELGFYIEPSKNMWIFEAFMQRAMLKSVDFNVYQFYQLIKVLTVAIRLEKGRDREFANKLIDCYRSVVEKCVDESVFFGLEERVHLLEHLALSRETCQGPLLNHLISLFSFEKNSYFVTELDNIPKNNNLSRVLERIEGFQDIELNLSKEFKKFLSLTEKYEGNDEFSINASLSEENLHSKWIKPEVVQYLTLLGIGAEGKFQIEENVREFSFDFGLKLKSHLQGKRDIYIDFFNVEKDAFRNFRNREREFVCGKIEYLTDVKKINYTYIFDWEWETMNKKELLSVKLSPFLN